MQSAEHITQQSTDQFVLRRLIHDDAEAYKRLRLRALKDHPDFYTSTYADWDQPAANFAERIESAFTLGAFCTLESPQKLVGTLTLAIHERKNPKLCHKVEIWSVYVAPEARGQGIARLMMEKCLILAREFGYVAVLLTVTAHNTVAHNLYKNLGFEEYGREPDAKRLPDGRRFDEILTQCVL